MVPEVNAQWSDEFIRQFGTADISVAVQTEHGLITPIVKNVESKGLAAISSEVKQLVEKARAKKLAPSEYQGGTFTVSNLGMFGIKHFTSIINPPQACSLAVGGVEQRVVVSETGKNNDDDFNSFIFLYSLARSTLLVNSDGVTL